MYWSRQLILTEMYWCCQYPKPVAPTIFMLDTKPVAPTIFMLDKFLAEMYWSCQYLFFY